MLLKRLEFTVETFFHAVFGLKKNRNKLNSVKQGNRVTQGLTETKLSSRCTPSGFWQNVKCYIFNCRLIKKFIRIFSDKNYAYKKQTKPEVLLENSVASEKCD